MNTPFPMVRLGEVLTQYTEFIETPEPRLYPKLSVRLYGRGVVLDTPVHGAALKMKRHQIAKAGQVILSEIWGKKGAIGYVPPDGDGALCTSHFFLFDVRTEKIDPSYLQAIFTANYLENQLDGKAKGTTGYAAVRPKHLLAAAIPLPPLEDQRRIVARIEELAAKIEEARELRRQAAEEADALISNARREWIGEAPDDDWIPLSRYVREIENGYSPNCESRPAEIEEWGVLKVGAVSFGTFNSTENKALPLTIQPLPCYEVSPGDFLMGRANTADLLGACSVVSRTRPRLLLSDKIFRFVFHEPNMINLHYLDHVLKSPALRTQIQRVATGTSPTMKNISKAKVLDLLVPSHDLPLQNRIAAVLDDAQKCVDVVRRHQADTSADLDALLPSILDRAFKGQL